MKKTLFLWLICSVSFVINAQTPINDDWFEVGNTAYNAELRSTTFISQDTGFAVGTGGAYLKTVDGGTTWTAYSTGYNYFFNKIIFTDHLTGYISGNLLNGAPGKLIKTIDGGNTWMEIYTSSNNFNNMFFLDANTGFIAAYGGVYKSINAGNTWTYAEPTNCYDINSVFFRTADSGFIAAVGKLRRSDDGGNNWTEVLANGWNQVTFTSASNGYALKSNNIVFRTTDRGSTWVQKGNTQLTGTKGICFINDSTGVAWSDPDYPGEISKTTDGGQTWVSVFNNPACQIANISLRSDGVYFACGSGGLIMKSTDLGNTWTILHQGNVPNKLNRMCFTNDSTIFAVGDGGLLLKSTDRAISWTALNSGVNVNLKAICSISPDTLFILGQNGAILKSVNTGQSWVTLSTGIVSQTNIKGDILFVTNKIGFAIMDKIYKTTDGGNTWAISYQGQTSFEICAPTHDTLYVASWGKILRSINAGATWDTSSTNSGFTTGIDYANSNKIIAARDQKYIFTTENGGTSWTTNLAVNKGFGDVRYYNDTTAYLSCMNGFLYKSVDNGLTWTQVISGTTRHLSEIYFGPDGTGYILGQDGLILRRLLAPSYSLEFEIEDDENIPINNATLTLNSASYTIGVDSVGGLAAGTYQYIISKPGYMSDTATIQLSSDSLILIVLKKFHTVSFNLSNIFSHPVNAAQVSLGVFGTEISNAGGLAVFTEVVKTNAVSLNIASSGYLTHNATLNILGDTSFAIELQADLDAPLAMAASNIGDLEFTANWQNVAAADSFRLFVSDDNFVTHLPGYNGVLVVGTSEAINGLTAGNQYKYKLKSVNEFGESDFSNTIQITTTTGINENIYKMIEIYPNPADDFIIIESENLITEVVIINTLGTEFPVLFNDRTDNKMVLKTADLCNGIYLIGLSTESTWVMKKIVINR